VKTKLCLGWLITLAISQTVSTASDWPQWRGPNRTGISTEKGLLKEWSKEGPKILWTIQKAGSGYSTPAVVGDRLYLLANEGVENEFVRAFSTQDGSLVWSTSLGKVGNPDQKPPFPGARSTPTIVGDSLYALSSDGDLACLDLASGKIRWTKNLRSDFGGKPGQWAYSESPLVDGDSLLFTPGGKDATIVALKKQTGEVIWKCATPEGDEAGYASIIPTDAGGTKQYVQLLAKGLVGIEASTGKLLWRFSRAVSRYGANIPTPVVGDGIIYAGSAGTGGGAVKLKAKEGGIEAEPLYFESKLPTAIGGCIKVDQFAYGTTAKALLCFDFATGQIKWEESALGAASLCYADGRLYLHGENGEVALVEPSSDGYREKGRFTPVNPPKRGQSMEKAWAFPVVANGRLYLREHGTLWCYAIQ
jgi:outer membrane protein assembly factor BamB